MAGVVGPWAATVAVAAVPRLGFVCPGALRAESAAGSTLPLSSRCRLEALQDPACGKPWVALVSSRNPANALELGLEAARGKRSSHRNSGRTFPACCASGSSPSQNARERAEEETEVSRLQAGMAERRAVDQSQNLMEDPYAPVETAMSSPVVTTTPDALVSSLLDSLSHYTGLPVVDAQGRCVGLISSEDIFRHQRSAGDSISRTRVSDVMSSPAVVISPHAPIAYAAGLMLKHNVHRLPVVDRQNLVVGIVSRTDIYEPLIPSVNPLFHRLVGESPY